ncbi:MAG: nucleotide-diphospho-sugar transferase-domain-containing protein [Benjaminiella poitrasii]|nr:MAG: nucleotide-diphospho-sugar transferase-domain-containing protein [Benjaminiella poitrasii]
MALLKLDKKKGLIGLSFVLIFTSLTFLVRFQSTFSELITTTPIDSSYLTNEQSFFDIDDTVSNSNSSILCSCPPTESTEEEEERPVEDNSNDKKLEIPESLPPPPQELMDKINANLLEDRVLIVATANYGMRNHVYNWIETLKRTGETKFLIFCFDQKLYDHLKLTGYGKRATLIPDIWYHQHVESDFKTYFSQEYRIITHSKTLVVQQLLYLDVNVFFSDVDVVWLRPGMVDYVTTLLRIRPETGVLFQQEGLNQQEVNSGFYLMRSTYEMKRLLAETIEIQDTSENSKTQQGAMNAALNNLNLDLRTSQIVLLDILHFPNGFVYYTHDLPNKHGIKPYIVHANYLVGEEKKQKLIESNFWYLNDTWLDQMDAKLEQKIKIKKKKNNTKH